MYVYFLEFWSVNNTSIYENFELKYAKDNILGWNI